MRSVLQNSTLPCQIWNPPEICTVGIFLEICTADNNNELNEDTDMIATQDMK